MATQTEIFKAAVKTSIEDKTAESSIINADIAARFYDAADLILAAVAQGAFVVIGDATPSTNPGASIGKRMWVTSTAGTYTNFSGLVVNANELAFLLDTGSGYTKVAIPLALSSYFTKTETDARYILGPTTLASVGKNIFNPANVVNNSYIDPSTGAETAGTNYARTGKIPVSASTAYVISGLGTVHNGLGIAYYNAAQTFLSRANTSADVSFYLLNTPASAAYLQFTCKTAKVGDNMVPTAIQVEKGTVATAFEAYATAISGINSTDLFAAYGNPNPVLDGHSITLKYYNNNAPAAAMNKTSDLLRIQVGKNIFDPANIIPNSYISPTDGSVQSGPGYTRTGFIPVSGSTQYVISGLSSVHYGLGYAFYDALQTLVSRNAAGGDVTNFQFTTPPSAVYVRFTVITGKPGDTTDVNTVQMEKGATPTTYEAYQTGIRKLAGYLIVADKGSGATPVLGNDLITLDYFNANAGGVPTKGKKGLFFGDSITANDTAPYTSWVTVAAPLLQLSSFANYARSGASFTDWVTSDLRQRLSEQITAAKDAAETADLIVVSIGTNDYGRQASMGSYTTAMSKPTLVSLDRTLIMEAARWAFWTIREVWPNAVCYYGMPLQRATRETADSLWLMDEVRKMANRYNFIIIEAHNESGVVKEFEFDNAVGRYLRDGLHPSDGPGKTQQGKYYANAIARKFFA